MGSISPAALWTDIPVQHEHRGAEGLAQPSHPVFGISLPL